MSTNVASIPEPAEAAFLDVFSGEIEKDGNRLMNNYSDGSTLPTFRITLRWVPGEKLIASVNMPLGMGFQERQGLEALFSKFDTETKVLLNHFEDEEGESHYQPYFPRTENPTILPGTFMPIHSSKFNVPEGCSHQDLYTKTLTTLRRSARASRLMSPMIQFFASHSRLPDRTEYRKCIQHGLALAAIHETATLSSEYDLYLQHTLFGQQGKALFQ